jgi:hypothetical protein
MFASPDAQERTFGVVLRLSARVSTLRAMDISILTKHSRSGSGAIGALSSCFSSITAAFKARHLRHAVSFLRQISEKKSPQFE